jgi:hypothetical protein
MVTGGMPEAVSRYVQTRQLLQVQSVLDDISHSLRSDFAKYKHTVPSLRLQEVFNAVVHQAGGKFMYSKAAEQSKDYQVKEALELFFFVLPNSRFVSFIFKVSKDASPLIYLALSFKRASA